LATECTLAIIKPDAVSRGIAADIIARISTAGLAIRAVKSLRLTGAEAEGFYAVHRSKGFFADLTAFMSSGKIIVLVLEAENAIPRWRETMGATDPAKATAGTIRRDFGTSIQENCTHGSDAADTAAFEIGYLFAGYELL
jgi:nucleoside-diphosphate kinase